MNNAFDADNFLSVCHSFSKRANECCGQIYELYRFKLSNSIKNHINSLPEDHRKQAEAIVRSNFDYCTEMQEEDGLDGFCSHGIERNWCPRCCDLDY